MIKICINVSYKQVTVLDNNMHIVSYRNGYMYSHVYMQREHNHYTCIIKHNRYRKVYRLSMS